MTAADIMISTTSSKLYAFCEAVPTAKHVPLQLPVGYFSASVEAAKYPTGTWSGTCFAVGTASHNAYSLLLVVLIIITLFCCYSLVFFYVMCCNATHVVFFFTLCVCVCVTKTFHNVSRTFCTFCVCVREKSLCETLFTRMSELHRV